MEDINNTKAALDAGVTMAGFDDRTGEVLGLPVAVVPNTMQLKVLDDAIKLSDARADKPRRREGAAVMQELASFIAHVNRFKDDNSAVFANVDDVTLTAVLDYHAAGKIADGGQRWGKHRSVYACPLSREWKLWTENDGRQMTQDQFAQFIEDHMDDLRAPVGNGQDKDLPMPADVLTMARNLIINSSGTFSRSMNPVTGESSLVCRVENDSTSTKIPRAFLLGLAVFEAGIPYAVEARMRMTLNGGRPLFAYALYRADEIKRDAFNEIRQTVGDKTGLPLFAGSPE